MRSFFALWHRRLRGTPWRASVTEAVGVVLAGLATLALGLTGLAITPWGSPWQPLWWHAIPLLLAGTVLLVKRRHPVPVLLAVVPLLAFDVWLGGSVGMVLVLFDALYSAAVHSGPTAPRRLLTTVAVVIGAGTGASAIGTGDLQVTVWTFIQLFAFLGTPLWWGMSVRHQQRLAELASERAADLQRLAEMRQAQALRQERNRMARELHDGLSSNLSAIAIHSEAALQPAPPDRAPGTGRERQALSGIRSASLAALEQMRSMVLLLREGDGEASPPARLTELPGLLEQVRATGLEVAAHVQPADLGPLPAQTEHAAYRIVQEALTNAVKHAGGGHADVAIHHDEDTLHVHVDSTPAEAARAGGVAEPAGESAHAHPRESGVGLAHMREWADLLGGRLTAGWHGEPGGRWHVRAELPLTGEVPR